MNNIATYKAKVSLEHGAAAPDVWIPGIGLAPIDSFVVSRTGSGEVLSRYGDAFWDLSPYHPRNQTAVLYFYLFSDKDTHPDIMPIIGEMRYLIFLIIWKRPGSPLSTQSLKGYVNSIRRIGVFANSKGCLISDVLNNAALLSEFSLHEESGSLLRIVSSLLKLLLRLGEQEVGFPVLGKNGHAILRAHIDAYFSGLKQYPPIPTRIYSNIISALRAEIDAWEAVEGQYLALLEQYIDNPLVGRNKNQQITISKRRSIVRKPGEYEDEFCTVLARFDLVCYFNSQALKHNGQGLLNGLSSVMNVIKLYIIAYSGMRNEEARCLPYNCNEIERSLDGREHCLILGGTTKFQVKRTRWVTSAEGHRAIRVMQRIADFIYRKIGNGPNRLDKPDDKYPLFISPAYLMGYSKHQESQVDGHFKPLANSFYSKSYTSLRGRLEPLIEEEDLRELEHIDPHRAWRTEEAFVLGQPWRLTEHQLRRSLALYAQRSGLVSLPSLRRQLQHLTEEMSRYYARGSMFAKDFIGDNKEHFGLEWQEAVPVSSGLAFIRDVLLADEPIFGGYVKWFDHRVSDPEGAIFLDRDATMRRFQNGEIAYKETPVGGCTKVGQCDELAIRFLDVDCLGGCPNLVGKLSKLEQVIKGQSALVSRLKEGSIEWKIESSDLDVLMETRNRVVQQRGGTQ